MPLVSRDRLAAACREADPAAVTAFVGALYAARGYEVERLDDGLLWLDPGDRTVAVSPAGQAEPPPEADAVVAVDSRIRTGDDTELIDADALHEQLAYGVDRSVAWDLLAARFDGGSAVETPVPTATPTATPAGDDRNGEAIAAAATPGAETPQQLDEAASEQLTGQPPPGVDEEGLADIDELIATHRSHLSDTSYTLTVEYRELEDGRVTGVYTETIRVENDSRYSVSVSTEGIIQTSPRAIVGADAFSNERRAWVRLRSTEPYVRSRLSTTRFLGQTARYLRWSLSVEESTLQDRRATGNRTVYRITTDGDPYQGVRNAAGTVYVTDDGLIRYGRWTYTSVRPEIRVEFTLRTTNVGSTTVSRPGWVDAGADGSG